MGDDNLFPWEEYRLPAFGVAKFDSKEPDLAPQFEPWTPHGSEQRLMAHSRTMCAGRYCAVHPERWSDHSLRKWMQWFEDGTTFRICPHGENHLDPDERKASPLMNACIAECDGCCVGPRQHDAAKRMKQQMDRVMEQQMQYQNLEQFKARKYDGSLLKAREPQMEMLAQYNHEDVGVTFDLQKALAYTKSAYAKSAKYR